MRPLLTPIFTSLLAVATYFALPVRSQTAPLSIEKLIDIKHPSNPVWSPDGHHVAFIWDRAGVSNLYLADAGRENTQTIAMTHFTEGQLNSVFWSRDGMLLYFPRQGDLWQVSATRGEPRPVWTTPAPESDIVPSPDGKQVAFVRPAETRSAG